MSYTAPRSRRAPELVTAYTVSEVESPVPGWGRMHPERSEDDFNVEEVFIAPPLPRVPDYHNSGRRYGSRRSKAWAPKPAPPAFYHEEYERVGHNPQDPIQETYHYGRRRAQSWHQPRAISPQPSDTSSGCSAPDCEECVYDESRRRYDDDGRSRFMKPVPYVIVPRRSDVPRATPSPVHANAGHSSVYNHGAPRVYRLHDSTELEHALGGPPPTRESSLIDNTSLIGESHNTVVLFRGTARSGDSGGRVGSDGMSIMHSNVSSPRWSVAGQRYLSSSETQSDARSHSPVTSLDGLYEHPNPKFAHQVHSPPGLHMRRPVVITRSDESYEHEHFGESGDYEEYVDISGSDGVYSGSERSFSSGSGEYYRHW